jgi:hypothetical protein
MNWQLTHEKAVRIGKEFKNLEGELISVLQEVEAEKVFSYLGFTSLFQYCLKVLKLSEDQSYTYIRIARASKEVPALKAALEMKSLSISNAKKIASVITVENQTEWLEKGQRLKSRELDREIVKSHPEKACREKVKPITESLYELRCTLSAEGEKHLKRALDIVAQNIGKTLEEVLKEFVERHDPVKKAERSLQRKRQAPVTKLVAYKNGKRTKVPQPLRHEAMKEANGQCSHQEPSGERCPNQRYLEVHHCRPVSIGGEHRLDNLQVLCSSHHRIEHRSSPGNKHSE